MQLLPELWVSVPVGKDSLSMRTRWTDAATGEARQVTSPVSLVVTAFACCPTCVARGPRSCARATCSCSSTSALVATGWAGRSRGRCRVSSVARFRTSMTRSGCSRSWRRWPTCGPARSRWRTTTVPTGPVGRGVRDGLRRCGRGRARRAVGGCAVRRGARRRAGVLPLAPRRCSRCSPATASVTWSR